MIVELLFNIPKYIFGGVNAICHLITAIIFVGYGILVEGPTADTVRKYGNANNVLTSADEDRERQRAEGKKMRELRKMASDDASLDTIKQEINYMSKDFDWKPQKIDSVRKDVIGLYFNRKIEEFIDDNSNLYDYDSDDRREELQDFNDLLKRAGDNLDERSIKDHKSNLYYKLETAAREIINEEVDDVSQDTLNDELIPNIRSFYQDLGYDIENINKIIDTYTKKWRRIQRRKAEEN